MDFNIESQDKEIPRQETSAILKEDMLKMKIRLEKMERELQKEIEEVERKEEKWKKLDNEVANVLQYQNSIVKINVSGKIFATKIDTLISLKDTLFYKIILSKKFDIKEEIFFDRSPKMFSYIIDYLRYKKIAFARFKKDEINDLRVEADYYEISPISDYFSSKSLDDEFVKFEFSGPFIFSGIIGTNNVKDISDRNLTTGICAMYPGWIILEMRDEFEFSELEIGGYAGNTSWSPENGAGSEIQTSLDKTNWVTVGTVPSGYGTEIKKVQVVKSSSKFIRIYSPHSYVGLGFLEIKRI